MEKQTSEKTSEQLKEWGCDLESEFSWLDKNEDDIGGHIYDIKEENNFVLVNNDFFEFFEGELGMARDVKDINRYIAYDLLWDVCIKYPEKFFKQRDYWNDTEMIFNYIRSNKKEEAEEYLLANTIFNPKNK